MTATYEQPSSVAEAIEILSDSSPPATIVAGGTDVLVGARAGKRSAPDTLLSIHALEELRAVETAPDGALRIGALVSHETLERSPLIRSQHAALADAATLIGSPATRSVGTIGGNVCNGSPAMDTGSPLIALGATIELVCTAGRRTLPLERFVRGPGAVALEADELAVSFEIPGRGPGRWGSAYVRLGVRHAMEIALVGAAAVLQLREDSSIGQARVCLTAVAPTCVRARDLEARLVGAHGPEAVGAAVAEARFDEAAPIDDVRASRGYRERMVRVMTSRALIRALERAERHA